tara:strand:+ start:1802 stop:1984 length:183 start_codon:yes stop_codon:yes gene_type:complete
MNTLKAIREIKSLKNGLETKIENLCLEVNSVDACEMIEAAHQDINSILKSLEIELSYLNL